MIGAASPVKPVVRRSSRWAVVALDHLARFPTCAACGSRIGVVVHHIVPVHVDRLLELVDTNLVTLCQGDTLNCHLWCGHLGHWRSWNETVIADAARFLARVRSRPWR